MSHDLIATVTFRNKRLRDAMAGRSGREIALVAGCNEQQVCGYGSLRVSPYRKNGDLKQAAKALCNYFELGAEELFPPSLYSGGIPSKIERSYSSVEMLPLLAARGQSYLLDEAKIDKDKLAEVMQDALKKLTYRERKILEMRFGLDGNGKRTPEEIGEFFALSGVRIRQIEAKAIRRMRHPVRSSPLAPFVTFETEDVEVSSTS